MDVYRKSYKTKNGRDISIELLDTAGREGTHSCWGANHDIHGRDYGVGGCVTRAAASALISSILL